MKSVVFLVVVLYVATCSGKVDKLQCDVRSIFTLPTGTSDMDDMCVGAVKRQIQDELNASMKYLSIGAHFSRDTVQRPGFAHFFFQSATEKREHVIKLIEYLLLRMPASQIADQIRVNPPNVETWNGTEALEAALETETQITKKIKYVIKVCEARNNDYHMVDYLTADFLTKQYHDQRNLAEKISTLKKMTVSEALESIGEFLFDKQLSI